VFNDQHTTPGIHQALQDLDQLVHVGGVQADRWLVRHVERAPDWRLVDVNDLISDWYRNILANPEVEVWLPRD
jgi:hypothetical protein